MHFIARRREIIENNISEVAPHHYARTRRVYYSLPRYSTVETSKSEEVERMEKAIESALQRTGMRGRLVIYENTQENTTRSPITAEEEPISTPLTSEFSLSTVQEASKTTAQVLPKNVRKLVEINKKISDLLSQFQGNKLATLPLYLSGVLNPNTPINYSVKVLRRLNKIFGGKAKESLDIWGKTLVDVGHELAEELSTSRRAPWQNTAEVKQEILDAIRQFMSSIGDCDLNGNGIIDVGDITLITQMANQISQQYPKARKIIERILSGFINLLMMKLQAGKTLNPEEINMLKQLYLKSIENFMDYLLG